jgi:hypothetical protein
LTSAEGFFRDSEYWSAWSTVPDVTADIAYALTAVEPRDSRILDVPRGRRRLLRAPFMHFERLPAAIAELARVCATRLYGRRQP